ncbi:MAG: recombinase family protein [Candidatus Didemnitutus sp.]|nr:recombinase family protein [Candidatus Didemnitutus sp.]
MSETLHIYTRVSSVSQAQDGTSLETQRGMGEKAAKALGMTPKIWDEGSGSSNDDNFADRPILTQLLSTVDAGKAKHIWVFNTDRLARTQAAWSLIRLKLVAQNVTLWTTSGEFDMSDPTDKLILGVLSEISAYDNALRTERSRLGKLNRIRQGYWMGGPPPYGYTVQNKRLVPDKDEAQWVKFIFESYRDGKTVNEIRKKLLQNGVATRRRKTVWSSASIEALLTNTHYSGHYVVTDKKSGEVISSTCDPILPISLTQAVAEAKKKRSVHRVKESSQKHFYLLRGLLFCGHCGCQLSGRTYAKQYRSVYYCPRRERNHANLDPTQARKCSNGRYLKIAETDDLIWKTVMDVLSTSELFKSHFKEKIFTEKQSYGERMREANRLEKKLRGIDREIEGYATAILAVQSGDTASQKSPEEVAKIVHDITGLKLGLEADRSKLIAEIQAKRAQVKWVNWLTEYSEDLAKKRDLKGEERRKVLDGVIKTISVTTVDTRRHRLTITFKQPYHGAKFHYLDPKVRSKGGAITGGTETVDIPVDEDDAKKNTSA